MKPPSRKRTRRLYGDEEPEPVSLGQKSPAGRKAPIQWRQGDLRKLLCALKRLSRTLKDQGDVDYVQLQKDVPSRSASEIQAVVDSLKDRVISHARFKCRQQRWEEKKELRPIEVWADMASAAAGGLEDPISTAFSQMLLVSSTEPRSLRNGDPPQFHRTPTDTERLAGRTVPLRPVPRVPLQGERPGLSSKPNPSRIIKTPPATVGPAKTLVAPSRVIRVPNSNTQHLSTTAGPSPTCPQTHTPVTGKSPPGSNCAATVVKMGTSSSDIHTNQQNSSVVSPTSVSKSISSGPSPSTGLTPIPGTSPSSAASSICPPPRPSPLQTPPPSRRDAPPLSPSMSLGVKSAVDFERIYRYLSAILNPEPDPERRLTAMESAIVLDLLMSLPEELPHLQCNKLHAHMIKVYQCLSSRADAKTSGKPFKDLLDSLGAQTDTGHEDIADSSSDTQREGEKLPDDAESNQSSSGNKTSSQSRDTGAMPLCPPLNPFLVPLKLLTRREDVQNA